MKQPPVRNQYLLLRDAIADIDQSDDEFDLVLLPPDNTDGDTDTELGNDSDLTDMTIETVSEVSGRIEIQTLKQTSKIKKAEGVKPKNPKARHRDLQK